MILGKRLDEVKMGSGLDPAFHPDEVGMGRELAK
jgi:hypothetical protein